MKKINILGQKYGSLEVIGGGEYVNGATKWICKCDCGNIVTVRRTDLVNGKQKTCGCGKSKRMTEMNTKHGDCNTRLYRTWCNMKSRCQNENEKDFKWYGGKGVKVCKEWEEFEHFKKWAIENGYEENLTIDRVDSGKDYCPENCRFIPLEENIRRAVEKHILNASGRSLNVRQWGKELGMSSYTIYSWVYNHGKEYAERRIEEITNKNSKENVACSNV